MNDSLLANIETADAATIVSLAKQNHTFSQAALDNALISASRCGYLFVIHTLVRIGADVNTQDTQGNTPLMICAENGFTDIAKFLINKHADINAVNSAGDTALILSIRSSGSLEVVKLLLGQKDVSVIHQNRQGYTALMKAIEMFDINAADLLLKAEPKSQKKTKARKRGKKSRNSNNPTLQPDVPTHQPVNCRGETVRDIAERCGVEKLYQLLKESSDKNISSLQCAVEIKDFENFLVLLDFKIVDTNNAQRVLRETFINTFKVKKQDKTFSEEQIHMIKKLLESGVQVQKDKSEADPLTIAIEAGAHELVETLCRYGAKVDQNSYRREMHPLNLAAKLGRTDLIELLLKYKAKVDNSRFVGSTLDCALVHGHTDCAKFLIQKGAKLDIKEAFKSALSHQNSVYTKFLLQTENQEDLKLLWQNKMIDDLLIDAVEGGNLEIIGQILDAGADINQSNESGATPLASSRNGEVAQFLIQREADVNQVMETRYGSVTALVYAFSRIESGYIRDSNLRHVIQVLVDSGANVHARDDHGRTALIMAAKRDGNESLLQSLLDHGAELSDIDNEGNTALHVSIKYCPHNALFLLRYIRNKSDLIDLQNNKGKTALIVAVKNDNTQIVETLIRKGADVSIQDDKGNMALLCAINRSTEEVVTALIKAGSDVNRQNNDGLSPLMLATKEHKKEIIAILLDSGVDVNAVSQTDRTKTAISFLVEDSYYSYYKDIFDCLELLLDRGASSTYLKPDLLHRMIKEGQVEVIPKLIRSGLAPSEFTPHYSMNYARWNSKISPMCAGLSVGNVALARYFVGNLFLVQSDLVSLSSNKDMRDFLESYRYQPCLDFLDEISSQPMSLFSLVFVSVSSWLGTGPGRENRVDMLPLPQKIKDRLLFKTEEVQLVT